MQFLQSHKIRTRMSARGIANSKRSDDQTWRTIFAAYCVSVDSILVPSTQLKTRWINSKSEAMLLGDCSKMCCIITQLFVRYCFFLLDYCCCYIVASCVSCVIKVQFYLQSCCLLWQNITRGRLTTSSGC